MKRVTEGERALLFERLVDEQPHQRSEPQPFRVLNKEQLAGSVRRELLSLLNTRTTVMPLADRNHVPYLWLDVSANELRMLLSGPADRETPAIAIAERSSVDEEFGEPVPAGPAAGEDGFPIPREAKWDASGTQLVVSAGRMDGNTDLYFSRCE